MRSSIPEKLLKIINEIDERGCVNPTRLTVLKKWFETAGRLPAFAIWVAGRANSRKGKTGGKAAELFRHTRALLTDVNMLFPALNRKEAEALHDRIRDFQNEYKRHRWGSVRIVRNWNLMLIEQALAIWLWHGDSPSDGYKLAADYCRHYAPQYGNGLNGRSQTEIQEIVRFMFRVEALEEDGE